MCMTVDNIVNLALLFMSCNKISDVAPYDHTLSTVLYIVMNRYIGVSRQMDNLYITWTIQRMRC